jgi:hypothetical protein
LTRKTLSCPKIKSKNSSEYFKTLKEPSIFMMEPPILSQFFDFQIFFLVGFWAMKILFASPVPREGFSQNGNHQ